MLLSHGDWNVSKGGIANLFTLTIEAVDIEVYNQSTQEYVFFSTGGVVIMIMIMIVILCLDRRRTIAAIKESGHLYGGL